MSLQVPYLVNDTDEQHATMKISDMVGVVSQLYTSSYISTLNSSMVKTNQDAFANDWGFDWNCGGTVSPTVGDPNPKLTFQGCAFYARCNGYSWRWRSDGCNIATDVNQKGCYYRPRRVRDAMGQAACDCYEQPFGSVDRPESCKTWHTF